MRSKLFIQSVFLIVTSLFSPSIISGVELKTVPKDAYYLLKPTQQVQLLLDDYCIGSRYNVDRVIQQPTKHDIVTVKAEYPWELGICTVCVVYDPEHDVFRMYYSAWPTKRDQQDWGVYTCYAESKNGFHFTKPMMHLFEHEGQPTNIIYKGDLEAGSMHVIYDTHDPDPQRRYKGVYNVRTPTGEKMEDHGLFIAFSADGIHWQDATQVTGTKVDTSAALVWFEPMQQYFAYTRAQRYFPFGGPVSYCRITGICTSTDAVHWTKKVGINLVDESVGWPLTQVHDFPVYAYGDALIGFPDHWYFTEAYSKQSVRTEYTIAVSHDGWHWEHVANRAPFVGEKMTRKGDTIYLYWGSALHTLPADRFVAVQQKNPERPGLVETKPLYFNGKDLILNAEVGDPADIRVELVNEKGPVVQYQNRKGIRCFKKEVSHLVRHDPLRWKVVWDCDGKELHLSDAGEHQPFVIRLLLNNGAKLYAYQIID